MKELDKELITEVSLKTGIAPAFVEKDYYIIQLLKILSKYKSDTFNVSFSGGTSLSKGFNLINRFSEDIDFMIFSKEADLRSSYRTFRENLFSDINATVYLKVSPEDKIIGNESRFVSFYVDYPKVFEDQSLRQQVKIEISAKSTKLPTECRKIDSWIDEYLGESSNLTIDCLSPLETAANKFSAFLWRAACKDRSSEEKKYNDPTIVRHLYDLYKLQTVIKSNNADFYALIAQIYEDDKNRGDKQNTLSLYDFASSTLQKIKDDKYYEGEYTTFVCNMVYKDSDIIPYYVVIKYFEQLVNDINNDMER